MRSSYLVFILLCVGARLLAAEISDSQGAITKADEYLRAFNWRYIYKPTVAEFPAGSQRWLVAYPHDPLSPTMDISLTLDGKTGVLLAADYRRGQQWVTPTATAEITARQALDKAQAVLIQAGASLEGMKLVRNAPGMYKGKFFAWVVQYDRYYHGYKVQEDTILVKLDPSNGVLLSLSAPLKSPLPTSTSVSVTGVQAERIAAKYLASHGAMLPGLTSRSAKLAIIPLLAGGSLPIKESHLAWLVHFGAHVTDVAVDARNGVVLD